MEKKYLEVPTDILTNKDMDYLSDIFLWNYNALKSSYNSLNSIDDEEIINLLFLVSNLIIFLSLSLDNNDALSITSNKSCLGATIFIINSSGINLDVSGYVPFNNLD